MSGAWLRESGLLALWRVALWRRLVTEWLAAQPDAGLAATRLPRSETDENTSDRIKLCW